MPAHGNVDFLSDRSKSCHPERSEGSRDVRGGTNAHEILRFAQNDIGCFDSAKRTLGCLSTPSDAVIQVGWGFNATPRWIPAFAGMTTIKICARRKDSGK
jgi:hypothetical protein